MSCYHPRTLKTITDYRTGEVHFLYTTDNGFYADIEKGEIRIPCGKCIGCLLDKSRSWADRMMLELDHSKKGIFVTFTYNNEHLKFGSVFSDGSSYPTLVKRDVQLFFKRLREHFDGIQIRYYLAGEYGSTTFRPHYHAIIYGLDLDDFTDKIIVGKNPFGQDYFSSPLLERLWSNGFVCFSDVSWRTCAYVARYVQKKVDEDIDGNFSSDDRGVEHEFSLMSRRPGIGGFYHLDHPDVFESNYTFVSNTSDIDQFSKKIFVPKYVFKHLESINPVLYNELRTSRSNFCKDREVLLLQNTDLDIVTYFEQEEQRKLQSSKKLLRKEL